MKKVLTLTLCSVLGFSTLTGCKSKPAQTENAADKITNVIWQYPTPGNNGPGFKDMENALNAMMEKDIGVHVKFEPVGLMDAQKKASLMVSAGEQLDISLTAFTSVGPLVESGLINPLDDLLEKYGQDIKAKCGSGLFGGSYNSKIYGIPPANAVGNAYGYMIQTDMLTKYGIDIDNNKKYTYDDLEKIFATVKAGEGKNFYCTIPWNTTQDPANNSFPEYDKLAGALSNGVLMLNKDFKNTTITNLFATTEYADYAKKMYDWAKKGYISPDAAVTKEPADSLMASGNYLGMFYWNGVTSAADYSSTIGKKLTAIPMIEPYVASNGGSVILWNIPITSKNPEKAMQALNYIYKNNEATKLIQFGIEGKSYKVNEKTAQGEQIEYLAKDTSTLPYYNPYGLWGSILEWPAVAPAPINKNQLIKEADAKIPKSRYSPAMGYSFVQKNVAAEIAAVNTVIDQYTPSINSGALDPSKALPDFLAALKAAGIEKTIQENQTQFNKWLQNKK
jgi:putative aldouronate transport system substrate-binding protein